MELMATGLNLLVLESHPGAADRAIASLEEAGHQVRRCHEGDGAAFPCKGLSGASDCPLDEPVDVTLLVRRGIAPRPTEHEDGVTCALRAHVPLVEDGADVLDPYEPFLTARVWAEDDVVQVVEAASQAALEELAADIRSSLVAFLVGAGRSEDSVEVRARAEHGVLHLELIGDDLDGTLAGRVSVKAADRARELPRRWRSIEVSVHEPVS